MIKFIKTYFIPFIALFIFFFDEIFSCAAIVGGFVVDNGMKKYEAIILSFIGYSIFFFNIVSGKISQKEQRIWSVLILILLLYSLTPIFYDGKSEYYQTYLLVFGSESIPAAYVGMKLAKSGSVSRIIDILPFFVIPISLLIGTIGVTAAMIGETVNQNSGYGVEEGLNYQNLSYYMAFSYTYALFYVLYGGPKKGLGNLALKVIMGADAVFCAVVCLTGGGRGAFVYIVFISAFILLYFFKSSAINRSHAVLFIALLAVVLFFLINSFGVMESAGMERILGNLTEDNARMELYRSAFSAFLSSPAIGMGVGSIWWTVGYYSHNIVLDLLAETGLVGTLFFTFVIWTTIKRLYRYSKWEKCFLFLLLVMSGALVNCMFSGYWIAAIKVYFVCSFVYCMPKFAFSNRIRNAFVQNSNELKKQFYIRK